MSAAKKTKSSAASAAANSSMNNNGMISIPTLSSVFAPAQTNNDCNCGCSNCCRTSTTVCLTFDTTFLQNLVNIFPKIQITNNNSCADDDCGCDDEEEPGK